MSKPKLHNCKVCGLSLPVNLRRVARHRGERMCYSPECVRTDIRQRYACCHRAEMLPCVCAYSFRCPVHGDTHIGTHD